MKTRVPQIPLVLAEAGTQFKKKTGLPLARE